MEVAETKSKFNQLVNSGEAITEAKMSLIEKTGKTKFNFSEIVKEIALLNPIKGAKIQ